MNIVKTKDREFKPVCVEASPLSDICASCDIKDLDICGIVECATFENGLKNFVYTEVNN
jgi:hypothetical protein